MKVIIDGKEIELELTEKQKAEIERVFKYKTGWERVRTGIYYQILENDIEQTGDEFTKYDNINYNNANYFNNEELIKNIIRAQTLQRKLWRKSAELCKKMNWDNDFIPKWDISYDHARQEFFIGKISPAESFGQVYFDTEEHAGQAIEEFRDELVWYFTEFKSRMD